MHFFNDKIVVPLRESLYVIIDKTNNVISFLFQVIKEKQNKVFDYVKEHYENVTIMIKDSWMKLDFDNDGKVSFEDLRQGVCELYEFLKNYNYIEKVRDIRSKLYVQAISHMRGNISSDDSVDSKDEP